MARIRWKFGDLCNCQSVRSSVRNELSMLQLTYWSLTYNAFTSWGTCIDTALEPMFWFVDHFVKVLGPAFVIIVVSLVLSVVVIFYVCLLPFKYAESYFWTAYHLLIGHWLLINTGFHYFKAAFTSPGSPPSVVPVLLSCLPLIALLFSTCWQDIPEVVSICKKCISPKPPRAHHCSVCDRCILKMDHHCPWLNNCVGHFNHRHFFLFCVYMTVGTIYVSFSAYPVFKEHFIGTSEISVSGYLYPIYLMKVVIEKFWPTKQTVTVSNNMTYVHPTRNPSGIDFHHFIFYEFMLCSAVALAVGLLTLWHASMIHIAETSIEIHINRKDKKRLAKKGKNILAAHTAAILPPTRG